MASDRTFPSDTHVLGLMVIGMREALVLSLKQLAAAHDNVPGEWLDQLEEEALRTVKNAHTEGLPLTKEAEAVGHALTLVGDIFVDLRSAIDEHNLRRP